MPRIGKARAHRLIDSLSPIISGLSSANIHVALLRDAEPDQVFVGVPARVVRSDVVQIRIRKEISFTVESIFGGGYAQHPVCEAILILLVTRAPDRLKPMLAMAQPS